MQIGDNGLLPAGIHETTLNECADVFVKLFPSSQSRGRIYESLLKYFNYINGKITPEEVWIDGSFASSKINPNDVDIVVFLRVDEFINFSENGEMDVCHTDIDAYYSIAVNDFNKAHMTEADYNQYAVNKRNYWRGQYGFDRSDSPKGIMKISWNAVVRFLSGGEC